MALSVRGNDPIHPDTNRAKFDLVGDLDTDGGKIARRALAHAIQAGQVDITVNLDQVGFLDSSGLGALIAVLRLARENGGDVRVETSNPRIRRIMEITALAQVFKMRPSAGIAA